MKYLINRFVEVTNGFSTETKKWEKVIFRFNILTSWFGCLFAIIAVCGICLTSCTNQEEKEVAKVEKISFEVFDLDDFKENNFYTDPFDLPENYLNSVLLKLGIDTIIDRIALVEFKQDKYYSEYFEHGFMISESKKIPYMLKTYSHDLNIKIEGVVGNYNYFYHDPMIGNYLENLVFEFD
ncbi:hypothetical protein K9M48_01010 [Candidatus Gracilibacteria bacterium]|nr:hypothetical protein [Candidatus Gracilibacteria bacterium]